MAGLKVSACGLAIRQVAGSEWFRTERNFQLTRYRTSRCEGSAKWIRQLAKCEPRLMARTKDGNYLSRKNDAKVVRSTKLCYRAWTSGQSKDHTCVRPTQPVFKYCLSSDIFSLLLMLSVTSHTKCFKHDVIVWQSSIAWNNRQFNVFMHFTQENEFWADFHVIILPMDTLQNTRKMFRLQPTSQVRWQCQLGKLGTKIMLSDVQLQ